MNKKIVFMTLEVPDGDFCQNLISGVTCKNLITDGVYKTCRVGFDIPASKKLRKIKKPNKCLSLSSFTTPMPMPVKRNL